MSHVLFQVNTCEKDWNDAFSILKNISTKVDSNRKMVQQMYEEHLKNFSLKSVEGSKSNTLKVKKSAILIPVILNNKNQLQILLTTRTSKVSLFQNEVSFPGGKWERSDESLTDTALRETFEEIGLKCSNIEIVSEFISISTLRRDRLYHVHSVIGLVKESFYAKLNKREVQDVLLIPLSDMFHSKTNKYDYPFISGPGLVNRHIDYRVFGLSYIMLAVLSQLIYVDVRFSDFLESFKNKSFPPFIILEILIRLNKTAKL